MSLHRLVLFGQLQKFCTDTGSEYTAQNYDISNIQGFTQSIGIAAAGCDTVACTSADCGVCDVLSMFEMTR